MEIKEIELGRGVSFEINKQWHKLNAKIKVELEEGENEDEVVEKTWDKIDNILSEKYSKITSSYEGIEDE
jgi:transcriptional regulator